MGWIKRNLWFTVGGVVALLLLGLALFYVYTSMSRNGTAYNKLDQIHQTIQQLTSQTPGPGNDKINNTQIAQDQEKQLRAWLQQPLQYFQPINPIPTNNPVTSEMFASSLRNTIDKLQREADAANVMLPPQYGFSFEAERSLVKFAPDGLQALTVQLGEVKAISEIFFAARVNALDAIQRLHVSSDDTTGPQGDYFDGQPTTSDTMTATPYIVTFRSFSTEISQVLANFTASSHGFIVRTINVQPASAAPMGVGGMPGQMSAPQPMPTMMPMRGGLQTVLKEQLLRITMEVDVVKLQPKS